MTPETLRAGITALNGAAPVAFAASELARYLALLAASSPDGASEITPRLRLGTFADFAAQGDTRPWPAVRHIGRDDAIYIDVAGLDGIIAGSNPRSVLLATYRYLAELGCRWVRPGQDGEYLPPVDLAASAVRVAETASYRHRGVCIEGAVGYEHARDLIDWLPKLGLNAYFTQFRESYTFFERWYAHRGNPTLPPETFSVERARELKAGLAEEIARRGLAFHDVGHGWTCEPLGVPGLGWEYAPPPVPPGMAQYLAEVNGKREFWRGVPIDTQLCLSNPEARALVVADIVAFAAAHPEVDTLHVWLGDRGNNHCECDGCRAMRPADWYVRLLNEADAALAAQGSATRIVFLVYVDLLWPPETERLQHPDRFILMFAPITRTYSAAFAAAPVPAGPLPPYERNRLTFPRAVGDNLAFLRAWQRDFAGDSFAYDYHLWWDHFRDPGGLASADILHQDIRGLAALGLDGLISCQVQRLDLPTGLGMATLGRALWDATLDLDTIAEDHFRATFGDDWAACLAYCAELSRLFLPPYLRAERPTVDPAAAASFAAIPGAVEAFRPIIRRNLDTEDACRARSWHLLDRHADLCLLLAAALRARAEGDDAAARSGWEATLRFAQEREADLHPVFDVYQFGYVIGRLFAPGGAVTPQL